MLFLEREEKTGEIISNSLDDWDSTYDLSFLQPWQRLRPTKRALNNNKIKQPHKKNLPGNACVFIKGVCLITLNRFAPLQYEACFLLCGLRLLKSQSERAKPWSYPCSAISNLAARFYMLSPWRHTATTLPHKRSARTEEELTVTSTDTHHWGIQSPATYAEGKDGQQSPPQSLYSKNLLEGGVFS